MTRDKEEGAYAVMYAILVVLLMGMAAFVVDLAMLRADKRTDRTNADFAVLAGAKEISTGPYFPQKACAIAWANLIASLGSQAPAANCGTLPADGIATCPAPGSPAEATANGIRIRIFWPVASDSALLTNPDGLSEGSTRTYDADFDGTAGGCDRLGVEITRTRDFVLASAIGFTSGASDARSVGRFTVKPGNAEYPYPLVLLDQHSCQVLSINGTGTAVEVRNNGDTPGRIGVDSDGAYKSNSDPHDSNSTRCNGGDQNANGVIMDVGGGAKMQTFDGASGDLATIEVFGPGGLPANTAISSKVHDCSSGVPCIWRAPTLRFQRITRLPFDNAYNCGTSNGCPGGSALTAYIDRFVTAAGAVTNSTSGWTVINASSTPSCSDANATLTATQYFVDCGTTWTVGGKWLFPAGATVIVNGHLAVANAGCFATNADAINLPDPCASPYAPTEPSTLTTNVRLSVRGDILSIGSGGKLVLPRTFVSQPTSSSRFSGSGFAVISWTAPYGDKTAMAADCSSSTVVAEMPPVSCFRNLAFWTEAPAADSNPEVITGGSALHMEGTYFMGNAKLKLSGGSGIDVNNSQFVAKRIEASGGSTLTFIPNIDRTTGVPLYGVALIR